MLILYKETLSSARYARPLNITFRRATRDLFTILSGGALRATPLQRFQAARYARLVDTICRRRATRARSSSLVDDTFKLRTIRRL